MWRRNRTTNIDLRCGRLLLPLSGVLDFYIHIYMSTPLYHRGPSSSHTHICIRTSAAHAHKSIAYHCGCMQLLYNNTIVRYQRVVGVQRDTHSVGYER